MVQDIKASIIAIDAKLVVRLTEGEKRRIKTLAVSQGLDPAASHPTGVRSLGGTASNAGTNG